MDSHKILLSLSKLTNQEITNVKRLSGGFQNVVFHFQMNNRPYIARLTPILKRSKALIDAELGYVESLKRNQIHVPDVITINDKYISTLIIDNESYWLTVFQYVEDKEIDVSDLSQWNNAFFYEWGKTIAKLHGISENMEEKINRPVWMDDEEINPMPSMLEESEPWLKEIYDDYKSRLATFPKTKERFGLIHNDLHQGNFFVKAQQLIIFDFDDCAYNWFVQDLSTSIYHALWTGSSYHPEWTTFQQEFLKHFLKGYTSSRSLTEADLTQLTLFLQIREVFLYLLFQKSWDHDHLEQWQSDKLIELEENLRQKKVPYEQELRMWMNETFNHHSS
ncbi:hypothetical protein HMPREF1210_02266 [Paenisporosarcina sp. HGH0030]|uniref:phosphotransferase enzyme family protein n=1 Tax=Paenisporosarcina sp. HGH0030 TaxID=1078085 RepID=UPI00034E6F72|nr:phosphotransferase [Paenisporosarcina sp. HGH0030]EPD51075.1 hypothetical protein HMPREF1210_02266 [Paenisporosarcina sp. HGH0030]